MGVNRFWTDLRSGAIAHRLWFYPALFVISLSAFTATFARGFTGIHGDGVFYYSYAVSLLWDHDLDLRNQLDTPDPRNPGKSYSRGYYSLDQKTGKAFSTYNIGTGLLMLPALAVGRAVDGLRGGNHPDLFDPFYQRIAGFSAPVVTALTILILFSILSNYFTFGTSLCIPLLFLTGSNWLFYTSVFATWSHVYALFLFAVMVWAFLRLLTKRTIGNALLFGLSGGLSFLTRNFAGFTFVCLFLYVAYDFLKNREAIQLRRATTLLSVAAILFFVGAAPQLAHNHTVHGSVLRTSWQAVADAPAAFGLFAKPGFRVLEPGNLQFLYSNLFNTDDGLFYCHPFYLVGLLGLLLFRPRDSNFRSLINLLLANLFLFWFLDAAYFDNWFNRAAGAGFGHRRYLDMLPLFIFGASGILDKSRCRTVTRIATFITYAALAATGAVFLREFIAHFGAVYAVRDSFFTLYAFLLASPLGWGFFAAFLALMFTLIPSDRAPAVHSQTWTARRPITVLVFAALCVLPRFLFKPDPSYNRLRFREMGGTFMAATPTPLVGLPGRDWRQPEGGIRSMRSSSAEIVLPVPLYGNDNLLLKLTPKLPEDLTGTRLNVRLGLESIGHFPIKRGRKVFRIRVPTGLTPSRVITIQFENEIPGSPAALLHEGRIVFKEQDDPPIGYVDFPPNRTILDTPSLIFEGWALDDRCVSKIVLKREPFQDELSPSLDSDGLIPLPFARFKWKSRPDVAGLDAVFPSMDEAGWELLLNRDSFPPAACGPVVIVVLACDDKTQRTEIGRREIVITGSVRERPSSGMGVQEASLKWQVPANGHSRAERTGAGTSPRSPARNNSR
ncbi:MAG TPA: hypothetical protein PKK12_00070 [Candidatus Aminicenantes bacterium]|nr:hypothetical protein [Candidatus Aminicenantes bacterium]